MRLGRTSTWMLLGTSALEVKFRRRLEKPGFPDYRRMLCTNDMGLLQSALGKRVLKYTPPSGRLNYDPASKNLILTWDIFMCNWRMINCNDYDVIAVIKTSPDPKPFWDYFYLRLANMSSVQKARFMNT